MSMPVCDTSALWLEFLQLAKERCSATAFNNWLSPIRFVECTDEEIVLEVPNIFVQEYLLSHFMAELCALFPLRASGEPAIRFLIAKREKAPPVLQMPAVLPSVQKVEAKSCEEQVPLNANYRFDNYVEGPHNQFVKSAAIGVANHPGQSYNPLFIHGGVGLGKTHLLHSIGHHVHQHHAHLRVACITTEAFINSLVDHLRNKSIGAMKQLYRSVDVLLVDDIPFLENRLGFEDEFVLTFEALIHQKKQIVITSDKPPSALSKLSKKMVTQLDWGLVAKLDPPNLETRVAILRLKAELRGLHIPQNVAFFIAEHIDSNVRQLEGAVNRLSAHCRLLNQEVTEELVEKALCEMIRIAPRDKITVEQILKGVAAVFSVRVSDLKSNARTEEVALPRQVAMYLAREMVKESVTMLASAFGRKHSTLLHAHSSIDKRMRSDEMLKRKIDMVCRNLPASGG